MNLNPCGTCHELQYPGRHSLERGIYFLEPAAGRKVDERDRRLSKRNTAIAVVIRAIR